MLGSAMEVVMFLHSADFHSSSQKSQTQSLPTTQTSVKSRLQMSRQFHEGSGPVQIIYSHQYPYTFSKRPQLLRQMHHCSENMTPTVNFQKRFFDSQEGILQSVPCLCLSLGVGAFQLLEKE